MLLEARGLIKRYGPREVLKGLHLNLDAGERLAILGPSGCGKSTLLNLLGGLDRPDQGALVFQGRDLAHLSHAELADLRRGTIGTIFQFFHLIPSLTARENIELPLRLLKRKDAGARATELLKAVDLAARSEAWPGELSGGEMQRVAVARALASRPALLLADEPTGNLDRASGAAVLDLLADLCTQEGTALVMVTHSDTAAAICHRRFRMSDGQLEAQG